MKIKIITMILGLMLVGAGCAGIVDQSNVNELEFDIGSDGDVLEENNVVFDSESVVIDSVAPVGQAQFVYTDYSPEVLERYQEKGLTVLFFHAGWCPTCRSADTDITKNGNVLPAELTIIKVDYDRERDLKRKYNVTTQHTFVQVDASGNEIKKWIGGSVALINQQLVQ
jgi:thiol-disulfide isomerase/thioredoxin